MRQSAAIVCGLGVLIAACSAEKTCTREAVESETERYRTLRDADGGRLSRHETVVAAGMRVSEASTQLATQNYEGCVESLKAARKALKDAEDAAREGE